MAGSVTLRPRAKRSVSTALLPLKSWGRPPSGAITNTAGNASKSSVIFTISSVPHQALGLDTPASHYQASRRVLPAKLPQPQYLDTDQVRLVRAKGEVRFKGHWLYAGQAFAGLPIAFRATQKDSLFEVFFSWKRIGQLDLRLLRSTPAPTYCGTGL
jgi:hypothetical protein